MRVTVRSAQAVSVVLRCSQQLLQAAGKVLVGCVKVCVPVFVGGACS